MVSLIGNLKEVEKTWYITKVQYGLHGQKQQHTIAIAAFQLKLKSVITKYVSRFGPIIVADSTECELYNE